MGCRFSYNPSPTFHSVRVIHINGYVEDFEAPVTVSQVTGKPPKHVLCTAAQLLATGSLPLLRSDDILESGRLYFLLPNSTFQSDTSPAVLASLVTRLTALARAGPGPASSKPGRQTGQMGSGSEENGSGRGVMCSRARTWMPDLSTINEQSMERSVMMDSSNSIDSTYELR